MFPDATKPGDDVIIIKIVQGDVLRRFTFKHAPNLNALKTEIRQLLLIPPEIEFQLFYKDEEDILLLNSDLEFEEAISSKNRILRIILKENPIVKESVFADSPEYSRLLAPELNASHVANTPLTTCHCIPSHNNGQSAFYFIPPHYDYFHRGNQRRHLNLPSRLERNEWKELKKQMKGMVLEKHRERKQLKNSFKQEQKFSKRHLMKSDENNELSSKFVLHTTIPDNSLIPSGCSFSKVWRFLNNGRVPWPVDSSLLLVGPKNNGLEAPDMTPLSTKLLVNPGDEVEVQINLLAPQEPGRYFASFCLADPSGRKFGQSVWVRIVVPSVSPSAQYEGDTFVTLPSYDQVMRSCSYQRKS